MKETEKVPFNSMPPLIRGLFLTKEQAKKLKEPFKDVVSVVRCKDCKHGEKAPTFKYYPDMTWCNKYLTSHNDDWFCADGERR